jgi:hypothetical protein
VLNWLILASTTVAAVIFALGAAKKLTDRRTTLQQLGQLRIPARAAEPARLALAMVDISAAALLVAAPAVVLWLLPPLLSAYSLTLPQSGCSCLAGPAWVNGRAKLRNVALIAGLSATHIALLHPNAPLTLIASLNGGSALALVVGRELHTRLRRQFEFSLGELR